jgi:hypothetical protein
MITPGMEVTIESDSGNELRHYAGKTGTVIAVIGCFAILSLNGKIRGCLTDYCQPKVTAATLAAKYGEEVV